MERDRIVLHIPIIKMVRKQRARSLRLILFERSQTFSASPKYREGTEHHSNLNF